MSNVETRKYGRARVDIVVPWGRTEECHLMDRITSFSAGGCFLQAGHRAEPGEEVFVKFWVPQEKTLRCEVRYQLEGIGLGLKFTDLSEEERGVLAGLVEDYRRAFPQ